MEGFLQDPRRTARSHLDSRGFVQTICQLYMGDDWAVVVFLSKCSLVGRDLARFCQDSQANSRLEALVNRSCKEPELGRQAVKPSVVNNLLFICTLNSFKMTSDSYFRGACQQPDSTNESYADDNMKTFKTNVYLKSCF